MPSLVCLDKKIVPEEIILAEVSENKSPVLEERTTEKRFFALFCFWKTAISYYSGGGARGSGFCESKKEMREYFYLALLAGISIDVELSRQVYFLKIHFWQKWRTDKEIFIK